MNKKRDYHKINAIELSQKSQKRRTILPFRKEKGGFLFSSGIAQMNDVTIDKERSFSNSWNIRSQEIRIYFVANQTYVEYNIDGTENKGQFSVISVISGHTICSTNGQLMGDN